MLTFAGEIMFTRPKTWLHAHCTVHVLVTQTVSVTYYAV